MNILKQSLSTSLSLLPRAKKYRSGNNKFFHFAFLYHKNNLISIGQNNPDKTNTRALKIAKKFNLDTTYPYLHAETDAISKIWNTYDINSNLTMVIIRLNKHGKLRNSKPCTKCKQVLEGVGINKVYWSINDGFNK